MRYGFARDALLAARLLETHHRATHEANARFLRYRATLAALSLVVVREDLLVLAWKSEQPRRVPEGVLSNEKTASRAGRSPRESRQLFAPELWKGDAETARRPAERGRRAEAAPVHALGDELQVVDEPHELTLG